MHGFLGREAHADRHTVYRRFSLQQRDLVKVEMLIIFAPFIETRCGSQVVRPGSAKPSFVGSIPTRTSTLQIHTNFQRLCFLAQRSSA